MQIVVVLLLGLCASGYAFFEEDMGYLEPHVEKELMENAAAKGCCTPVQWEGYMAEDTGYYDFHRRRPGAMFVGGKLSYDAKSKKVAATIRTSRHPRNPVKLIMDFSQQKRYLIYANGTKCSVSKTKRAFKPACIPSTAKMVGTFYQGVGKNKITETGFYIAGKRFKVMAAVGKSGNQCIPIAEHAAGMMRGVGFSTHVAFANITPGIKDPKVFKPPKSCRSVDEEDHYFGEEYPMMQYIAEKFHEDVDED